jgi:phosphatidylserine/phosphatidylglycerophosphate/cardiolipin synthase-like enzyme
MPGTRLSAWSKLLRGTFCGALLGTTLPALMGMIGACNTAALQTPPPPSEQDAATIGEDATAPLVDGATPDAGDVPIEPTTQVRVVVQPSDDAQSLINAVSRAQSSVHVSMYLLTNRAFIAALIERKNAGKDVKVILNRRFPVPMDENNNTYNQLRSAGVDVVWAPSGFTFTHSKMVIVDAKEAWIMTMNVTQTSASDNREYLLVDTQANDVAECEAVFAADYRNQTFPAASRLVLSPLNTRPRLLGLIRSATTTIDMESEGLSDFDVVDALIERERAGVQVRIVVDPESSMQPSTQGAIGRLKRGGADVRTYGPIDGHAKAIVVDGKLLYAGSINFTKTSFDENREVGLIVSEPNTVRTIKTTIERDFAEGTPL